MRFQFLTLGFLCIALLTACGESAEPRDSERAAALRTVAAKLTPLHKPLGKPQPGDWLASHKEAGQTFAEYIRADPVMPTGRRTVIYVQPLGPFTKKQREIVELSADYLGRYFNRPVKIKKNLPISIIPPKARRTHPTWGVKQILSTHVLHNVLRPRLPRDAAAYIAFTASDLWPGEGWNFVFGQASLRHRVGVWSIHRNGDPEKGEAAFRQCLLRTIKVATHETGHMFSMSHCTAFECNMCGSNSRRESDRLPLYLCPQCLAKVCWATGADPIKRYRALAEFCKEHGLKDQQAHCEKAIKVLGP